MEIVIIHHHINPGGVTRIIESQVSGLKRNFPDANIKILVGEHHEGFQVSKDDADIVIIPKLNYLTEIKDKGALIKEYKKIYASIKNEISKNAILHVHNLNLGKNPLLTYAVFKLAVEGYSIVNHAHDFAEDRPNNWDFLTEIIQIELNEDLQKVLYPEIPNYVIGVLNSFDYNRLLQQGYNKKNLYLIPNPVNLSNTTQNNHKISFKKEIIDQLLLDSDKQIITYPVRVIERKNIGEYILLSTLFNDKANWLVTQPPKNPKEITIYNKWVAFCKEKEINIHFEVGQKVDFEKLIAATDLCFTTSKREGFGMAYMEPWMSGTPVKGRNLRYITTDLEQRGMHFPYLYDTLLVNQKDFASLNMEEQMEVISSCIENKLNKEKIIDDNKHLLNIFNPIDKGILAHNKEVIRTGFSLQKYAEELYEIYERLVGQS